MNRHELFKGCEGNYNELYFMDFIEHGLKSNNDFLKDTSRIVDKILISRNQLNRERFNSFYDFNYPSYETCKEILKDELYGYNTISFLMVLFDWYELYDENKLLSKSALTLAVYLKRHKYIKKKLELVNESYFLEPLYIEERISTNLFFETLDMGNIDVIDIDHEEHYEDFELHEKRNEYDFNSYDHIDKIPIFKFEYTKYEIVNDFDIAYRSYKNGDRSNEVLSKLFSVDPYKYDEYIGESEFFLVFARHDIYYDYAESKKYFKNKYNIYYINILFPNSTQSTFEYKIDIPEYNLYVAAVKMNNKRLIKRLLKLYEEHGKFYKKMDLEKQVFIDEEIYEIPEVKPLNLITGDILNPYHELKKSSNIQV
ncbi:hypothetical protein CLIB1423_06S06150 [[Candida] railenensis]|uniref:Uncharacterized protein n=1 Tax=[Candida] railenensis TaxID=45579 RepID=A0A9P0QPB3_9ASCO|nr:hypothetical protein CLIB1423_06S06150 [[Candida] railenensis]